MSDILTKSPEQLHAQSSKNEEKQKEEKSQVSNLDNKQFNIYMETTSTMKRIYAFRQNLTRPCLLNINDTWDVFRTRKVNFGI